jgi:hypothetical protein
MQDFHSRIFGKKDTIEFNDFLKIFALKMPDYTQTDVKNAFKFLAGIEDEYIPVSKIEELLVKNGMNSDEVKFIMSQIDGFVDNEHRFMYAKFLQNLGIMKEQ